MSSFKIRPRFKHQIQGISEEVEMRLKTSIEKQSGRFSISHLPGHLYIKIDQEHQHIWSPQLHLSFEQEESNVIIRGLYGPNPTIWAVFFFGYVAIGLLALFLGMWGVSLWSLGMDASILWVLPFLALAAVLLYISAQAGQKMGAQEMFDIHHAYQQVSGDHVEVQ